MGDTVLQRAVMEVIADDSQFSAAMARVIALSEKAENAAVRGAGQAGAVFTRVGASAAQGATQIEASTNQVERAVRSLQLELAKATASPAQFAQIKADLKGISDVRYDALVAGLRAVETETKKAAEAARADVEAKKAQAAADRELIALERQLLVLAGDRAKVAEFDAKKAGLKPEQYEPYIKQLREMDAAQKASAASARLSAQSLQFVGLSAKQAEASMRQLPAQFTDIFTSLAAGQNPLIVMLQQVGQIKDQFGGLRNAMIAMASAFNPVTVGVGLVVGSLATLTYAFKAAGEEQQALRRSLLLTGNTAGTSVEALNAAAKAVGNVVGTQGKAAEVLAALASTGRVAARDLEALAEAAIRLEREGGPAVKDTVAQFAELGKSPTQGALKLAESTKTFTLAVLDQIRALESQGRTLEAASLAQRTLAENSTTAAKTLEENAGTVERAWKGTKDLFKEIGDAILAIGRAPALETQLAAARAQLAAVRKELSDLPGGAAGGRADFLKADIGRLEAFIAKTQEAVSSTESLRDAQDAAGRAAGAALIKQEEALRRPKQVYEEQVKALTALRDKALASARTAEEATAINERFAESIKRVGQASEYTAENVALMQARIAAAAAVSNEQSANKLIELQLKREAGLIREIDYIEQVRRVTLNVMAAEQQRLQAQISAASALGPKALPEITRLQGQINALAEKAAGVVVKSLGDIDAVMRKVSIALTTATLAWQEQEQNDWAKHWSDQSKAADTLNLALAEQEVALRDSAVVLREELALATLDERSRRLRIELLKIEQKERRELAKIASDTNLTPGAKAVASAKVNELAAEEGRQAGQRFAQEFNLSAMKQLEDGLINAFMDGGKAGIDYIKSLFKRELFRIYVEPTIRGTLAPMIGQALGASGAPGFGGFGGLGVQGMFNSFATSGVGNSLGLSAMTDYGVALSELGSGISSFIGTVGQAVPYVAAFVAAVELIKSMDSSGTPHFGGYAAFLPSGLRDTSYGAGEANRRADLDDAVSSLLKPVATSLNALVDTFKLGARFGVGGTFKAEDAAKDGGWGVVQISRGASTIFNRADGTLSADPKVAFEDYAKLLGTSVREALDSLDLPGWADSLIAQLDQTAKTEDILAAVDQIVQTQAALDALADTFSTIGGIFTRIAESGGDAQKTLADVFGGIDVLAQRASTYYDLFFNDAEKAARATRVITEALGEVGLAVPSTRETFRSLVESQDLTTESGRDAFRTLLDVASIFAELNPILKETVETGRTAADIAKEREGLEKRLYALQGNTAALRELELNALDVSNRGLQLQIFALEDLAVAATRAVEIAREREGLEVRLLTLQGDVVNLRNRELAALDASNQNLLLNIFALEDMREAQQRASATVTAMADAAERLAAAQNGVQSALRALQDYRQGLTDQISRLANDINDVRQRAFSNVESAKDRFASAVRAIGAAAETAAQRVKTAAEAIAAAVSQRASAATSIAGFITGQQGTVSAAQSGVQAALQNLFSGQLTANANVVSALSSLLSEQTSAMTGVQVALATLRDTAAGSLGAVEAALKGLQGEVASAQQGVTNARQRITDAYLSAQDKATAAQERLSELQARATSSTEDLAAVMRQLSESISDYLIELVGTTGPAASRVGVNRSMFLDVAARAQAGDSTAASQLVGLARQFQASSLAGSSSGAQFDADIRLIRQTLGRFGPVAAAPEATDNLAEQIAEAQADLSEALAEVERLRGIALEAGASLTATSVDLLGEWRAAQATLTAAQDAYNTATAQAQAAGFTLGAELPAFASALQTFIGAQAAYRDAIVQAEAAGITLSEALTPFATALVAFRDAQTNYTNALNAALGAGVDLAAPLEGFAGALLEFTSAQSTFQSALEAAQSAGLEFVSAQPEFVAALETLASAQTALDATLTRVTEAGVDFGLADARDELQTLIDGYLEADAAIETATLAWMDAVSESARATDAYTSALAMAADAGVTVSLRSETLGDLFEELGFASRELIEAQHTLATVGNPETVLGLEAEYRNLIDTSSALIGQLEAFDRRVTDIDFNELDKLDPLGDLLQQYADAVNTLLDAIADQPAAGQWTDIGGGFNRYISSGGAVMVSSLGGESMIAGKDGRSFSLGAVQEFVRQQFEAGNLRQIYEDAVAMGISSADLERITGVGRAVLDWATTSGLPAFASGSPYVPNTGVAVVHEGERILTATDNARLMTALAGGPDVVDELRALGRKLDAIEAAGVSVAESTRRSYNALRDFTVEGVPVVNLTGTTLDMTP